MTGGATLSERVESVGYWFHSLDLGSGVVTPGVKSPEQMRAELESLKLPELRDKTVLDIGAFDGFFSFEAERRGARSVLALDHYVWSLDLRGVMRYWAECKERGESPLPYHQTPHWRPEELPGKAGFDLARESLGSKVEPLVADFMTTDPSSVGEFDVVLFLGVLYHMTDPLGALKRVFDMTRECAVVQTEAIKTPLDAELSLCEFLESNELNADISNWWVPNLKALCGLCRAAGFTRVETIAGPLPEGVGPGLTRYRAVVHAWK